MNSYSAIRRSPFANFDLFWPSLAVGAFALALYARTLAAGLTWAHSGSDGGDLLAAALTGGVPHPPGYPAYQLLLRGVLALVPGDPARTGNWLSAVCAALAVGLLTDLARRTLPERPWRGATALVAGLAWAASPTLWSQAVITEVYALNALVVAALLWLAWRWREAVQSGQTGTAWLAAASLLLGLGLGNHLSLVWMLPGIAAWLWSNRASLGRMVTIQPLSQREHPERSPTVVGWDAVEGCDMRDDRSTSFDCVAGTTPPLRSGCSATAEWLRRMPAWGWIAVGAAGLIGLSVYAYLPLMAAGAPPVNWGDPRTPAQFWWLISGRAYRGLPFGVELAYLPGRLAAWVADALRQFGGPWGALIALAGLWRIDRSDHAWWRLTGLTALTYSLYAIGYNAADSYVYLIPVWIVAALWLAAGLDWGLGIADCRLQIADCGTQNAKRKTQMANRRSQHAIRNTRYAICSLLFAVLLLLPGVSLIRFWGEMDLRRDHEARDYVAGVLSAAAADAVILTASDGPTFALWYARYGLGQRPDLIPINVNLYVYPWYKETLVSVHPALADLAGADTLPTLDRLIAELQPHHPLYRSEPLNVTFAGMVERPVGTLVQMLVDK